MIKGAVAACGVVAAALSVLSVVVVVVVTPSRVAHPVTAQITARMTTTMMGLIFIGVVLATGMPASPGQADLPKWKFF
jgi:hypothetical protein